MNNERNHIQVTIGNKARNVRANMDALMAGGKNRRDALQIVASDMAISIDYAAWLATIPIINNKGIGVKHEG